MAKTTNTYYGSTPQDLAYQIASQAGSDTELATALAFGAESESGFDPTSSGSGGVGAFGFTPPSAWGLTWGSAQQAGPSVAAILPAYQASIAGTGTPGYREYQATGAYGVPSNLTGAAQAEFVTIAAEGPEYDISELTQIAQTGRVAQYGAAAREDPTARYQAALAELSGQGVSVPSSGPSSPGHVVSVSPAQSATLSISTVTGGSAPGSSDAILTGYELTGIAPTQIGTILSSQTHQTYEEAPVGGKTPGWSWNPWTDVVHTYDDISGAVGALNIPNDIDRLFSNIRKFFESLIVRIGSVLLGLLLMGGGLLLLISAAGGSGTINVPGNARRASPAESAAAGTGGMVEDVAIVGAAA